MTEINHAIGAEGIVSAECKEVITQYGELIWDLLISGVRLTLNFLVFFLCFSIFICISLVYKLIIYIVQVQPGKACSQVGLCMFNGTKHVR